MSLKAISQNEFTALSLKYFISLALRPNLSIFTSVALMHQTFLFYSIFWGLYRGICSYNYHGSYNIFFLKCVNFFVCLLVFLAVVSDILSYKKRSCCTVTRYFLLTFFQYIARLSVLLYQIIILRIFYFYFTVALKASYFLLDYSSKTYFSSLFQTEADSFQWTCWIGSKIKLNDSFTNWNDSIAAVLNISNSLIQWSSLQVYWIVHVWLKMSQEPGFECECDYWREK